MHTRIIIELEFDETPTRKDVYEYLLDLIGDNSLDFERVVEEVNDEVFEGETEALNKLYRDVGLPVEDSEPTDDQSLDEILEKDVEDTSMEEILKIADYLDKQGGES